MFLGGRVFVFVFVCWCFLFAISKHLSFFWSLLPLIIVNGHVVTDGLDIDPKCSTSPQSGMVTKESMTVWMVVRQSSPDGNG